MRHGDRISYLFKNEVYNRELLLTSKICFKYGLWVVGVGNCGYVRGQGKNRRRNQF